MAKARAKSKKRSTKPRSTTPSIGHNSDQQAIKDELLKVAKAQRQLDKRKATARAEFKEEQDKLTGRLKEIGISRKAFRLPYENFCHLADAEDDTDARRVQEDNKLYLAQQRIAFDALSAGQTIDWIDLVQDADQIAKGRESAERKQAEEAAAAGDAPDETETEL